MKLAAIPDEIAWRVARTEFSGSHADMFSGEGAAKSDDGRWNSEGKRVVHASDSRALALLELVVHLKKTEPMGNYSCCKLSIPSRLCERFDVEDLPDGWDAPAVNPMVSQLWGDDWLSYGRTPVAKVPSVIVRQEWNFLVNPGHKDFKYIYIGLGEIEPFSIDSRIKGTLAG